MWKAREWKPFRVETIPVLPCIKFISEEEEPDHMFSELGRKAWESAGGFRGVITQV